MIVVRTKGEVREALEPARAAGRSIGLVPTMGFLHDGHVALLHAARERTETVVMSLFVNPAQFGEGEDLDAYPRDEARDLRLAEEAGVDIVWAPPVEEVYPPGFDTAVAVGDDLTGVLCGDPERRGPEHFRGVTTVVAKLFNIVRPTHAFFGRKDAQQAIVIRRMSTDLDFDVAIETVETVREPDGLAMSSRNAYLGPGERERASALSRALAGVERAAASGERDIGRAMQVARAELAAAGIDPEYLEARDAETLAPAQSFNGRPVLVAVAARVGKARLIDNKVIGG